MPIYLNNRRAAHAWISQTTITAGQLHIATRDGEAMFFHDSIDLSPYAGTDAGSTPYRFVFVDSTGKQAVAYGGAVGGGEAFTVLTVNSDFDSGDTGWMKGTGVTISDSGGGDYKAYGVDVAFGVSALQESPIFYTGRMYRAEAVLSVLSGGVKIRRYIPPDSFSDELTSAGTATLSTWTSNYSGAVMSYMLVTTAPCSFTCELFKYEYYTDIPATGLHLMSAKNGTTRGMTLFESGFNPNTITKIRIYA